MKTMTNIWIIKPDMKNNEIDLNDSCYIDIYWNIKKEILKETYNINWKSPKELNPNIIYN